MAQDTTIQCRPLVISHCAGKKLPIFSSLVAIRCLELLYVGAILNYFLFVTFPPEFRYFVPPFSGNFTFFVTSSAPSSFVLSLSREGSLDECAPHRQLEGSPTKPVTLELESGGAYFLEASTLATFEYGDAAPLLDVGVRLPDGTYFHSIPDRFFTLFL